MREIPRKSFIAFEALFGMGTIMLSVHCELLQDNLIQSYKYLTQHCVAHLRYLLKRPTTSKKQPETTYNDLKRSTANKKQAETIHNE